MHGIDKWLNILQKSSGVHNASFVGSLTILQRPICEAGA